MLLASKTLVIVSFALEQLFEVGFAVKFTLKRCKTAKAARNGGIKELHADHSGQEKKNKKTKNQYTIYNHLSLALQCLQQKHAEWKTRLFATSFSIG